MKGTRYRASRSCNLAGVALLASLSYVGSADAITITNTDLLFEAGAATVTLTNPTGNVSWTLLDIAGNIVASGTASGTNGSINLNSIPAGYYRLSLGALFQGTIDTSVGIITNLSTVPNASTNKFGTTAHPEILPSPNYASLLAKGGLSFMRFDMRWPQIEPTAGNYTFAPTTPYFIDYDALISSLTTANIKPLAVLGYSNPAYDNDTRPYSPAGRAAYAAYAAAIADRYGAQLEYEIFNEYNHPDGFAQGNCDWSVSCYLPMLQAAEAAIHAEAPTAKVVLTGMAGLSPLWLGGDTQVQPEYNFISYNWLKDFLDAGGASYVDVFNIHNYTVETGTGALTFGNPEGDNETIVQNVKSLLANYPAASGKPLWMTETGWSTYPTIGVSEAVQAAYLVRDAVLTLRKGLDRYEFYDLFDDSPYASPDGNWGMLRHPQYNPAIAPKPAFVAQAVLSRKLDGYTYSSSDSLGANVYSLVFTKSGSPSVRVMWTSNPNATGVDVAASAAFNVTSTLGTVRSVTPSSGTAVLALSGNPIYVVGSSVSGVSLHSGNPSGGADLALGKSVVSSSDSGGNVGANTVDAGVSTYWRSASLPATLTIDMAASYDVHTVKVSLPPEWTWWRNETIAIQASTDGINFSTISAAKSYGFTNTNNFLVSIDLPVTTARYIRVSVTANSLNTGAEIGKLEIYGL
ncbi:discoidin domain-containing protein [Peristeroidobacter soli]|uniref:discoidin domain-containing protein n=1 Tax=Peristeroidobacter soli TaxID=2497877 RepID=UPI00158A2737|nr:discoidin domain-containing protein [Peristeroidobacter soli]